MIATLLDRPSETIETYLYVFIVAYLVIFARRIRELEAGPRGHSAELTRPAFGDCLFQR